DDFESSPSCQICQWWRCVSTGTLTSSQSLAEASTFRVDQSRPYLVARSRRFGPRNDVESGKAAMHSINVSLLVFAIVSGVVLLGIFLRRVLPEEHFNADAKVVIRLSTGFVVTMTGLVLG